MWAQGVAERIKSANEEKVRHGKTEKDRKGGAHARRMNNHAERRAWSAEAKSNAHLRSEAFPVYTLGGKGHSSVVIKMVRGMRTKFHKQRKKQS